MTTHSTTYRCISKDQQLLLKREDESYKTTCIRWFRKTDLDTTISFIFKKIILTSLVFFLSASILGIPLLIEGIREWKEQEKSQDVIKLVEGRQGACQGEIQTPCVQSILSQLHKKAPVGIRFNRKKITGCITGGVCSAMALDFATNYLKMKTQCNITEKSSLQRLIAYLQNIGTCYNSSPNTVPSHIQTFMNRQAAFNCIEVDPQKEIDFSRAKVQALANFHHLPITSASKTISFKPTLPQKTKKLIAREIDCLIRGVYLFRIIQPAHNEKLEKHGHSMIFIKEKQGTFLYDPNKGIMFMTNNIATKIFDVLEENYRNFNIHKARFYKLQ